MSARASLAEVAAFVGVPQIEILRQFPADIAVPRDYIMQGARVMISVPTIRRIAAEFDAAARVATGNRLREFVDQMMPPSAREVAS